MHVYGVYNMCMCMYVCIWCVMYIERLANKGVGGMSLVHGGSEEKINSSDHKGQSLMITARYIFALYLNPSEVISKGSYIPLLDESAIDSL